MHVITQKCSVTVTQMHTHIYTLTHTHTHTHTHTESTVMFSKMFNPTDTALFQWQTSHGKYTAMSMNNHSSCLNHYVHISVGRCKYHLIYNNSENITLFRPTEVVDSFRNILHTSLLIFISAFLMPFKFIINPNTSRQHSVLRRNNDFKEK